MRPCVLRGRRVEVILTMAVSEAIENYLETILVLHNQKGTVRSIDIANELQFSKPSVSVAMKNLRENGYILMDDQGHITLSSMGKEMMSKLSVGVESCFHARKPARS